MKINGFALFSAFFMILALQSVSQTLNQLPRTDLKSLDNKTVNSSTFTNDGKPIVICFWATWCKPCVKELEVYSEHLKDWKSETGVKLIAISIDNARSMSRVAPFVNGKGWEFDVYLDPNEDFKRALNVLNVPHTFLLDGAGNIVWQHTSYADGDEVELYEKVKLLSSGQKVN
jgi:cytochrome c biogenesis protein CcmG/thiol:disulfide interchange protein DsbE